MSPSDEARRYSTLLQEALSYDPENPDLDAVYAGLDAGDYQLWPGPASVVVTQLSRHPSGLSCHVWLAAGTLDEISAMQPAIEAWARSVGCDRMSVAGRPGWERTWLRHTGYRPRFTILDKAL